MSNLHTLRLDMSILHDRIDMSSHDITSQMCHTCVTHVTCQFCTRYDLTCQFCTHDDFTVRCQFCTHCDLTYILQNWHLTLNPMTVRCQICTHYDLTCQFCMTSHTLRLYMSIVWRITKSHITTIHVNSCMTHYEVTHYDYTCQFMYDTLRLDMSIVHDITTWHVNSCMTSRHVCRSSHMSILHTLRLVMYDEFVTGILHTWRLDMHDERICILQQTAMHCNTLQHTATHCNTLLQTLTLTTWHAWRAEFVTHVESSCAQRTLPCVALCCSVLQRPICAEDFYRSLVT